jgi:hypothetical protein
MELNGPYLSTYEPSSLSFDETSSSNLSQLK